jgi:hypothetical protein
MRGRHAEAQHSAADLLDHSSIDHEAQTEELDGDLRRPNEDDIRYEPRCSPDKIREIISFGNQRGSYMRRKGGTGWSGASS